MNKELFYFELVKSLKVYHFKLEHYHLLAILQVVVGEVNKLLGKEEVFRFLHT